MITKYHYYFFLRCLQCNFLFSSRLMTTASKIGKRLRQWAEISVRLKRFSDQTPHLYISFTLNPFLTRSHFDQLLFPNPSPRSRVIPFLCLRDETISTMSVCVFLRLVAQHTPLPPPTGTAWCPHCVPSTFFLFYIISTICCFKLFL